MASDFSASSCMDFYIMTQTPIEGYTAASSRAENVFKLLINNIQSLVLQAFQQNNPKIGNKLTTAVDKIKKHSQ
jgi:hypothetical protein